MTTASFTKQHEYVKMNDDEAIIGITDFAQNKLGDIVYVDLPNVGDTFEKDDVFGSVESVKAASDIYMPAGGQVVAVNTQLSESPQIVNESAMTDGWFIKAKINDLKELDTLMDASAYAKHCAEEEH